MVNPIPPALQAVDRWQQRHRLAAMAFAVNKKFGDDGANQFVVALGWYGFVSIFPLLLVVITVLGFIGAASLGHGIVSTLHDFPVVGQQFNPARRAASLHGSVPGLVIGLVMLVYGAQGVTQTAQQAMGQVWNVPHADRPGFLPRLARSLLGLIIIGGSFVVNAAVATYATSATPQVVVRVLVILGMLLMNAALYAASFRVLTPKTIGSRALLPGATVGGAGFTLLITVGSGLVQHQIRHSSAVYGQFGVVIGLVGFLFLLAKISLYGAELNPVLARRLWPRSLTDRLTAADRRVLRDVALQQRRRPDEQIAVGFQPERPPTKGGTAMNAIDVLTDGFARVREAVSDTLHGLEPGQLTARPTERANSIAWLLWHLARVQDDHVADVAGHEQCWTAGGWCDRFGLPLEPTATGYGHGPDEVSALRVEDPELLQGYYDAVHEATLAFLGGIDEPTLDAVVDTAWDPPVTLGVRLVSVLADDLQHVGQAAYLRGLLTA